MKLFGKFLMVLCVLGSLHLYGQEKPRVQNPNSIRPIDEEDVHYFFNSSCSSIVRIRSAVFPSPYGFSIDDILAYK